MRLGEQKDPRYLSASDLEKFAVQAGLARRVVFSELKRLADRVEKEGKHLEAEFGKDAGNRTIVSRIMSVLAARAEKARYILKG